MKPGQRFFCQNCHSQSIAKLERRLDGFTVVEEYLTCAFCHARISDESSNPSDKTENAPHILMIIIGIFGDIFYLLGGIFGLVAEHENEEN